MCEPAIQQGFGPDVISSDIHASSGNSPGKPFMPWVMSKFLNLGYTLEQVVAMSTLNPAKVIDRLPKLGTLQIGAPGDVSVFDLIEGPVSLSTRVITRARGTGIFGQCIRFGRGGCLAGRLILCLRLIRESDDSLCRLG